MKEKMELANPPKAENKEEKMIRFLLLSIILIVLAGCTTDKERDKQIRYALLKNDYFIAKLLVQKHYANNQQKAMAWFMTINKSEDDNYKDSLEIQKEWKWTAGEYGHDYVRGSIKNIGSKPVGYWKITIHFMDKDKNIVDTGSTNSIETLLPNTEKQFEIMHPSSSKHKSASISVEEASIKR